MSRMKRYGWVGTGFLTLTAAVSLFTTKQADAQWHSSPAPVKVVNDLSLVGDVGTPHRQPFQGTFFVQIENGEFTASASFTPAGGQTTCNQRCCIRSPATSRPGSSEGGGRRFE
jgi:hypothetical protein